MLNKIYAETILCGGWGNYLYSSSKYAQWVYLAYLSKFSSEMIQDVWHYIAFVEQRST